MRGRSWEMIKPPKRGSDVRSVGEKTITNMLSRLRELFFQFFASLARRANFAQERRARDDQWVLTLLKEFQTSVDPYRF
jgi:hypothetical protein